MNNVLIGITHLVDGFELMTKPGVKRFVAIPVAINILLFISAFFLLRHFVGQFNAWFLHFLPTWLHWLSYILWFLFFISFFIVFVYAFVTLANIIAAPFNSLLSEKVENYLTGHTSASLSLFENVKDVPRILGRQLGILGYYLPRAILLLILFFIPVVHVIVPFLWFLFNAWFLAFTYIDYPTDNHRVPLVEVRIWLKQNRSTSLGFGMAVLVVTMVPVVNLFAIPAAVAGATKYWVMTQKNANL